MTRDSERAATAHTEARPRSRWWSRWPLIVGLLSLLVWLLPTLVAVTPLRSLVLRLAESELPAGVSVGSAQLSWDKPVQFNDVRVEDNTGREVLHVERIESQQTLWELARQRLERGLFHVFRPRLTLVIRDRSTVIDSKVLKMLRKQQAALSAGRTERGLEFELANGEIRLVDASGQLLTQINDIVLDFRSETAGDAAGRLHASGRIAEPATDGSIRVEAEWTGLTPATSSGRVLVHLDRVPLDAINPRLRPYIPKRRLAGETSGSVDFQWRPLPSGGTSSQTQVEASTVRLTLFETESDRELATWSFDDLKVHCEAVAEGTDELHINELEISSRPLQAGLGGSLARTKSGVLVDIDGEVSSHPQLLLDLIGQTAAIPLRLEGLSARRLVVRGPIPVRRSSASTAQAAAYGHADVAWTGLEIAGLQSSGGVVTAHWQPGRLGLKPQAVPVNGGRIVALPWIDLDAPQALVLDAGPVAEDLQLTPEMTRTWLKYVSPVMADAVEVDGRVSLLTRGGRLPLNEPQSGQIEGVLRIHEARVGPGALARQILPIVQKASQIFNGRLRRQDQVGVQLVAKDQDVAFELSDGRVHHERMEFRAGDVVLASSGSVGLDESLDLILEIPLPEHWLRLRGRSTRSADGVLRIPVTGTLDRPEIDPAPLAELNQQLATEAAEKLIRDLFGQ